VAQVQASKPSASLCTALPLQLEQHDGAALSVSTPMSAATPDHFLVIIDSSAPWHHNVTGGCPAAAVTTPMLAPPADTTAAPSPGTPACAAKKGV